MDGDVLGVDCSRFGDDCSEWNEREQQVVRTVRRGVVGLSVRRGGVTEIGG
ncbi:hypothetical protein A2U01_0107234, partial [Trifolium medium]|nr:hypothetical protein [Trifolium medium]